MTKWICEIGASIWIYYKEINKPSAYMKRRRRRQRNPLGLFWVSITNPCIICKCNSLVCGTAVALRAARDLPDIMQTAPLVSVSFPTWHHVCSFCSYMQITRLTQEFISTCMKELSHSETRKDVTIVAKRMFANRDWNVQPLHVYPFIHSVFCLTTGPKPLPHSAIYSFLLQVRVSSPVLKVIQ